MSWTCPQCAAFNDEIHENCWKCRTHRIPPPGITRPDGKIVCSTTPEIPGRQIDTSLGVVFGEAILGINMVRDLLAGVRDIVGGRSGTYESKLKQGRSIALEEMTLSASDLGADAIVGIAIGYETFHGTMLMITLSGTAVTLKPTT